MLDPQDCSAARGMERLTSEDGLQCAQLRASLLPNEEDDPDRDDRLRVAGGCARILRLSAGMWQQREGADLGAGRLLIEQAAVHNGGGLTAKQESVMRASRRVHSTHPTTQAGGGPVSGGAISYPLISLTHDTSFRHSWPSRLGGTLRRT
jgi:hypothetical protein